MAKQILSEEFRKMQKIAGITTENVSGNVKMDDETFKKINDLVNPGNKYSADYINFIDSALKIMEIAYNYNKNDLSLKEVFNYLFTVLEDELENEV